MYGTMQEIHLTLPLLFPNIFDFRSTIGFLNKANVDLLSHYPSKHRFSKERIPRAFKDNNLNSKLLAAMILPQLLEFVKGHEWNNKKSYLTPFAYKGCDEKYYVKQAFVCKKN